MKGDERAAAETAVKIYRGMIDTWDQSQSAPKAKDWTKTMSKYLSGAAYSSWARTYTGMRDAGAHFTGYLQAPKAAVTTVDLHPGKDSAPNVTIEACIDYSNAKAVNPDGSIVTATAKPKWIVTVEKLPKYGWSIRFPPNEYKNGKAEPCAA